MRVSHSSVAAPQFTHLLAGRMLFCVDVDMNRVAPDDGSADKLTIWSKTILAYYHNIFHEETLGPLIQHG